LPLTHGFCVRQENASASADAEKLIKQPMFLEVKKKKRKKNLWENIQAIKQE